ncbi:MAG: TetR/AcrR family transcriptional regulator [Nocardioides sp.]|nr:TetR/AcrR family transcriptional regulator [Nocardioides sp.]
MSLREAKRRATARALAQAAFDLAHEHGVDGFTIDEVAARAGYSRRTFANHYAGKEEAIVAVATERVRHALDTPPDEDLPLVDWLQTVARQQLSAGLLMELRDLRVLAERHPPLRPHLLEVQRCIRETAREAVLARLDGRGSRIYAHLLVGAAYGALTCLLDGHIPVRLPATPAQDPTPHSDIDVTGDEDTSEMTLEDFVDLTFTHLREGF